MFLLLLCQFIWIWCVYLMLFYLLHASVLFVPGWARYPALVGCKARFGADPGNTTSGQCALMWAVRSHGCDFLYIFMIYFCIYCTLYNIAQFICRTLAFGECYLLSHATKNKDLSLISKTSSDPILSDLKIISIWHSTDVSNQEIRHDSVPQIYASSDGFFLRKARVF